MTPVGTWQGRFVVILFAAVITLDAAGTSAQLRATLVATGLQSPVGFFQNPADATMQIVIEQAGRVRVLKNGVLQSADFLDLRSTIASGGEQGLLGFAFAPDYATSGRVYASFTDRSGNSVIARFTRSSSDPLRGDLGSRFDLMWPGGRRFIVQPFTNHNGGNIAFGPDGFLYFGLGDGGSGNDPFHAAQDPATLLGKMLRLDVSVPASNERGYVVPASNPFVGRAGVLGEIWSFGLRNPWRWSFDIGRGGTGALVIADVGQSAWEEIDYEPANAGGRNYGWRNREGAHDHVTSRPPFSAPLREPIFEYSHAVGDSVTGGVVYRGDALGSAYFGRYFFADFIGSRVWSIALIVDGSSREATAANLIEHTADLASAAANPSSFGVDAAGEVYLVSYLGSIYRLEHLAGSTGRRRNDGAAIVGTAKPR